MKTHRILAVAVVLAGLVLMLQTPPRVWAQDAPAPAQDQAQPQDQQNQAPAADVQAQTQNQNQDQNQDQNNDDQPPAQDPPGRVARLHQSVGSVSFQPGGQGDWVQAVQNRPLTAGDNIWADKDSRAELQMGSTSIRMDAETSLTFLALDDHSTQLKLSQGSIIFRVRHLDDGDSFEVDTPNSAFVVQRPGEYRADVNASGNETDVTVWQGRGEVTGGGSSYDVVAGQRARFSGTDQLDHEIDQVPARDDFDEWAFGQDQHEDRAESSNYISPEMTGADDLDDYGSWHYAADYGPVWTPVGVGVDWAPYRFGHWVWVAPWGWTWVENEPWGFAPFHYGRWAFVGASWCWVPGPILVRPVYAPALVAFVGGGGFGVGFGAGVAWFPLGPREVFVPWYRTSRVYVNNVNITNTRVNVTQVTNVYNTRNVTRVTYVNQHVGNAVTAVSHDTFVNARPVATNLARVDQKQLENAPVTRSIAAQPSKSSVMGAGGPARAVPPARVAERQVVATRTPAPVRSSFEQRPPASNVRTENPGIPHPPVRTEPEPQRPAANPRLVEQGTPPAQEPAAIGHTDTRTPAEGTTRASAPIPRPPAVQGGHPLVRQAPPVEQHPEQQKSEEQKFNRWQQQRPKAAPAPRAPEHVAEPHPPHK